LGRRDGSQRLPEAIRAARAGTVPRPGGLSTYEFHPCHVLRAWPPIFQRTYRVSCPILSVASARSRAGTRSGRGCWGSRRPVRCLPSQFTASVEVTPLFPSRERHQQRRARPVAGRSSRTSAAAVWHVGGAPRPPLLTCVFKTADPCRRHWSCHRPWHVSRPITPPAGVHSVADDHNGPPEAR
jgi:hypothetical protein